MVLIEMTCPCEENIEAWHNTKVSKHVPLKSIIENNSWNFDLFVVKVGAGGYCSRWVLSCFKILGLSNRTIHTTKQPSWPEGHGPLKKLAFFKKQSKIHLFTKIHRQLPPKKSLPKQV